MNILITLDAPLVEAINQKRMELGGIPRTAAIRKLIRLGCMVDIRLAAGIDSRGGITIVSPPVEAVPETKGLQLYFCDHCRAGEHEKCNLHHCGCFDGGHKWKQGDSEWK